jgi:hypothetical protein
MMFGIAQSKLNSIPEISITSRLFTGLRLWLTPKLGDFEKLKVSLESFGNVSFILSPSGSG